jgi:cytochrome c
LVGAGLANAQSGADLLKSKGCVNCHAPDTKKVGPSVKDIAAKHKDTKNTDDVVAKLKSGKGHPKVSGSDADIKAAVDAMLK